jgi:hypothetical protein
MNRADIDELHYICPIENLPLIVANGILSHKRADKVKHRSVAMPEMQERRKRVVIPGARPLHDYVNLYINARNKMMYKIVCNTGINTICVLQVDSGVLDLPDVVISDRNAAGDYPKFAPSPKGLSNIDKDLVFARYWNHPDDPIESMRHGSIVCAEVLVPDRLDPRYIKGAYVANQQATEAVAAAASGLKVTINTNMFFR